MKSIISLQAIQWAMEFYGARGYVPIDVPMTVSREAVMATLPPMAKAQLHGDAGEFYVGSAEQSFLELRKRGLLAYDGKYMALTPCRRDEPVIDDLHYNTFLKLELISIGSEKNDVIVDALAFLSEMGHVGQIVIEPTIGDDGHIDGLDILLNGIEFGSYGLRKMLDGTPYCYGTGIAEPRYSTAKMFHG